jgi:diguanylate cyclase
VSFDQGGCGEIAVPPGRPQPTSSIAADAAFADVTAAATAVLGQLRRQVGYRFWAFTRVTGDTYLVHTTGDAGFPAGPGEHLPWVDTICHQVIDGGAPRIAADINTVPALRGHPLVRRWRVAAYLSAPLTLDGAALFGTLCALDRAPQPSRIIDQLPLVELQARLLSTVLAGDLRVDAARRNVERSQAEALLDPLTDLVNRRGWQLLLDQEEQRCRRYGAVASVLVVDLDRLKAVNDSQGHAAGDSVLQEAARVLGGATRSADVVARLGGDEFAVLAVETDLAAALRKRDRLQDLLAHAGVRASIGVAGREAVRGLAGAWADADADMYRAKRAKPRSPGR